MIFVVLDLFLIRPSKGNAPSAGLVLGMAKP